VSTPERGTGPKVLKANPAAACAARGQRRCGGSHTTAAARLRQQRSITAPCAAIVTLALLAIAAGVAAQIPDAREAKRQSGRVTAPGVFPDRVDVRYAAPPAGDWRNAPSYVDLVAPRTRRDDYSAFVTARPLDDVLRDLAGDPSLLRPPGAWTPEALGTRDAFGEGGEANAWTVARLYGGTAVRVARGPRSDGRGVVESWTLVTPYPDRTLRYLERGTLLLIARVPPL